MDENIVDNRSEKEQSYYIMMKKKEEEENRSLCNLLSSLEGRRYILRQLKRAFPLGGGSLCAGSEGTFYNLGKFESYLEILLDLQQAVGCEKSKERQYVTDILSAWFFDDELSWQ